jgi:pyruvate,water dikinase
MNSANLHSEERKVDIEAYKKQMIGNKTGSQVKAIEFLIKQTRNSVYNREYTKSGFIRLIDNLKIAYRSLADILVQNKLLPDADLIYFLTHQELGDLINNNKVSLIKKAILRKRLLPEQFECQYDDVYIGKPSPKPKYVDDHNINSLSGDPISRGIIKGIARVINSPEDAKTLKEGEIMVVKFTDIG